MGKKLRATMDSRKRGKLAALCEALGLPSSFYIELVDIGRVEITIKDNGQATEGDVEAPV